MLCVYDVFVLVVACSSLVCDTPLFDVGASNLVVFFFTMAIHCDCLGTHNIFQCFFCGGAGDVIVTIVMSDVDYDTTIESAVERTPSTSLVCLATIVFYFL